jgi:hypothetical protein
MYCFTQLRLCSLIAIALLSSLAQPCAAQTERTERTLVISPSAEAVSLSVYRNPDGKPPIDGEWPNGYALITETRTVELPAGEIVLRFEGVADGMFPESAIVSGLPTGVREKNRDARLLSPLGLVDAYLKRTVNLRRTNRRTGLVRDMQARITAAPNGAVILESSEGFEALNCTGLPERMLFDQVPANLSAKPTLSVLATSTQAVKATVTLSYMAEGFDWHANYLFTVQSLSDGGAARVDLLAWLTLVNGGEQSFINSQTVVVAGAPNRVARKAAVLPEGGALRLQCWPSGRTDQVPRRTQLTPDDKRAPGEPGDEETLDLVMVTGRRVSASEMSAAPVMVAEQEDLGDLKLYRVPEPVTVNANGQKQVALMLKPGVKLDAYYTAAFADSDEEQPMYLTFRTDNHLKNGLGLPLPSGQAEVFEQTDIGPLWLGASSIRDFAIGEKLELYISPASDVRMTTVEEKRSSKESEVARSAIDNQESSWRLTLSNAKPNAVSAEVMIPFKLARSVKAIKRIDGVPTWKTTIPANGEVSIQFAVVLD